MKLHDASYRCIDAGRIGRWSYSLWQRDGDDVRKCYIGKSVHRFYMGESVIDVPPDVSLEQFKKWLADLPAVKERENVTHRG